MDQIPDNFTLSDRRELIRQGLKLDELTQDTLDLKVLFNDAIKRYEDSFANTQRSLEARLRNLEDEALEFRTQLKTFLLVASLLGGGIGTAVEVIMHVWFPLK